MWKWQLQQAKQYYHSELLKRQQLRKVELLDNRPIRNEALLCNTYAGQEPQKCYNDFKYALKELQDLNETPKFDKMEEDEEYSRIRNIIEKLKITIQDFEIIKNSLLPINDELKNKRNIFTKNEKDINELKILEELIKRIDEIIKVTKIILDDKNNYQLFLRTCGDAKSKTLTLSDKLIVLQQWDAKLINSRQSQQMYNKLIESSRNIRNEIDDIIKTTPIGLQYSCKILEDRFLETFRKIQANKNILKNLMNGFPNYFTINKLKRFVDKNNPLLKDLEQILDKLTQGLPDDLDELEKKLISMYDFLKEAFKKDMEKIKEIHGKIKEWDDYLKDLYGQIPSIRKEIDELKKKKQLQIQYNEFVKKEQELNSLKNSLSKAYCSIPSKPEE